MFESSRSLRINSVLIQLEDSLCIVETQFVAIGQSCVFVNTYSNTCSVTNLSDISVVDKYLLRSAGTDLERKEKSAGENGPLSSK